MPPAPAQLRNKERTESRFVGKRGAFSQPVSYLFPSCLLFIPNQPRNDSSNNLLFNCPSPGRASRLLSKPWLYNFRWSKSLHPHVLSGKFGSDFYQRRYTALLL